MIVALKASVLELKSAISYLWVLQNLELVEQLVQVLERPERVHRLHVQPMKYAVLSLVLANRHVQLTLKEQQQHKRFAELTWVVVATQRQSAVLGDTVF